MKPTTHDVVILGDARTPVAESVGAFNDGPAIEVGKYAAGAALERTGACAEQIAMIIKHEVDALFRA